jgi:hypothetical protein
LNSVKEKPEKVHIAEMGGPAWEIQARVVCAWLPVADCHFVDGNWEWRLGR